MQEPAHIVVLGAGFGGLEFCHRMRHAPVRITLVDRSNHHLFQPLLYQVATAGCPLPKLRSPFQMARHVAHLIQGEIASSTSVARPPFRYWDKGTMATIGRTAAVAQMGSVHLSGLVAWLA